MRGRPKKYRIVHHDPRIAQFSPRGKPGRPDEANLSVDEFEALYLADFMGYAQGKAADSMRVSQQTFSRIIRRARKTVADAIVRGKIIKIQGGLYVLSKKEDLPIEKDARHMTQDTGKNKNEEAPKEVRNRNRA